MSDLLKTSEILEIVKDSLGLRIVAQKNMVGTIVARFEDELVDAMELFSGAVCFDLTRIKEIDSRGIALCVGLYKECVGRSVHFSMEVSAELMRTFKLVKIDKVIEIREA